MITNYFDNRDIIDQQIIFEKILIFQNINNLKKLRINCE